MFENKYVLATLCILVNVVSSSLMKGGLGYKKDGIQVVPEWAMKLGAKPMEITIGHGWGQILKVATNVPFVLGALLGLIFFAFWSSLISKAGLGFANGFMALFMVAISIVSFYLFNEPFNGLKAAGLLIVIAGVFVLSLAEKQLAP